MRRTKSCRKMYKHIQWTKLKKGFGPYLAATNCMMSPHSSHPTPPHPLPPPPLCTLPTSTHPCSFIVGIDRDFQCVGGAWFLFGVSLSERRVDIRCRLQRRLGDGPGRGGVGWGGGGEGRVGRELKPFLCNVHGLLSRVECLGENVPSWALC